MATGAAGANGRPAVEERWDGAESVTTPHPAPMALHAEDCSKTPQSAKV